MSEPVRRRRRIIATVQDYTGLIDAFRAVKDQLQLSNATIDTLCGFTLGHTDKLLGPTCVRALSPLTFNGLAWALALKIEISLDMDRVKEMTEHWEKRNAAHTRELPSRISKVIVARAKPIVLTDLSKLGNEARSRKLPGKLRSQIASKASRTRWRRVRELRRASRNAPCSQLPAQSSERTPRASTSEKA